MTSVRNADALKNVNVKRKRAAVRTDVKVYAGMFVKKSVRRFVKTVMTDGRVAVTTDGRTDEMMTVTRDGQAVEMIAATTDVVTDGTDVTTEEITDGQIIAMIPAVAMTKQGFIA